MRSERTARRTGFTLIELLVVIGVIVVIAGLIVYFGPGIEKGERSARGASALQGNLFIAKQQALRNRLPYGIRLLRGSNSPTLPNGNPDPDFNKIRSFQYISQPLDYRRGNVKADTGTTNVVFFDGPDLTGGLADRSLWLVQPGDALQVGNEPPTLITEVNRAVDPPNTVRTNAANGATGFETNDYRVFRAPRPAAGEEIINLPEEIIVDLDPNNGMSEIAPETTTGYLDILFAPSGRILNTAGRAGRIVLWVRDETTAADSSEQSLIVVFTRSGLIGSVPVDVGGADLKSFLKDPRTYGGM